MLKKRIDKDTLTILNVTINRLGNVETRRDNGRNVVGLMHMLEEVVGAGLEQNAELFWFARDVDAIATR